MPRLHSWLGFGWRRGHCCLGKFAVGVGRDVILYASMQVFFFLDRTVIIGSLGSGCGFHPLGQNDTLPDF